MNDKIKDAYRSSRNVYDDVLDQRNIFSRLYIRIFWDGTDDRKIAEKILSWIPDDFAGSILDVPAGTAVFTEQKWRRLKEAKITCLDYSEDMLRQAENRLGDCTNITFRQGDVGSLPMGNDTYDVVISMNGFHAFPDKERAFSEVCRVLKPGGTFIACFYIRGISKVTDWLVNHILSKKGWFTPPFLTEKEVKARLSEHCRQIEMHTDGSIVYFRGRKQLHLGKNRTI